MTFEVVIRWGHDLLDVRHVDKSCRIGDVEIALVDGARGRIGHVEYIVSRATLPRRTLPYARTGDLCIAPYLGLALAVHLAVWGVATTAAPPPEPAIYAQPESRPTSVHSFADGAADQPDEEDDESPDDKEHGQGTPMALDRGRAGADRARDNGQIAVEETHATPRLSRSEALELAREHAIIGSTAVTADELRVLTGSVDFTSAFDTATVNGALAGGEGASAGSWGTSYSGDLRGGGADGTGTIGVGELGAFSNGLSDGEGWGAEPVPCGPGGNLTVEICKKFYGKQCIHDGISPRVTVRVVERRRAYRKLARCWADAYFYDHEVSEGPLRVDFTIERTGRVTNVRADGITAYVERCVAGVYAKIKFPRTRTATDVRHMIVYKRSTIR